MLLSVLRVCLCILELRIVSFRFQMFYNLEKRVDCGHCARGAQWTERPGSYPQVSGLKERVPRPFPVLCLWRDSSGSDKGFPGEEDASRRSFRVFGPVTQGIFLFRPTSFQLEAEDTPSTPCFRACVQGGPAWVLSPSCYSSVSQGHGHRTEKSQG